MLAQSSSRSSRTSERNARLDPLGIYGTRSERRRSQLQRRRQWQNSILWLLGILLVAFGIWWLLQPHPTSLRATWTRELPFRPATAPVAAPDGRLLFTSQSGGLWAMKQGGPPTRLFSTAFAPVAAPLVSRSSVFWPGGDGILRSLAFPSGKERWNRALPDTITSRPVSIRLANRQVVVAGDGGGHVAAFDAVSGVPVWSRALGGAVGEAIVALPDAKPGILVPLLAGARSRGGLVCLDAATGAPRWRFPSDTRSQGGGITAPAVVDNRIYWCNDEGAVIALEGVKGQKIWKTFAAPRPGKGGATTDEWLVTLRGAPTVDLGSKTLVVGGNDGLLRAFDLDSGKPRWSLDMDGPVHFPAQLVDFENRKAFLASGDSPNIFLLDPATGFVLRRWTTPFDADLGVLIDGTMAFALDAQGHLQGAVLR